MLNLLDLDDRTRELMLREIDRDIEAGTLYISPRLTDLGQSDYAKLLRDAAERHDSSWLESQLREPDRLRGKECRRRADGHLTSIAVPEDIAQTLAESEFNRFYMRATCLRAIADGALQVVIYWAGNGKTAPDPTGAKIGQRVGPRGLLRDLRDDASLDRVLHMPSGTANGLSVRLSCD